MIPEALAMLSLMFPAPDASAPSREAVVHRREFYCAALTVFSEARGEPFLGQLYVAASIRNRSEDPRWPDLLCDVVSQPGQYVGFKTWKLPRTPWKRDPQQWAIAESVVTIAMLRMYDDNCSRSVLYFFNPHALTFKAPPRQTVVCHVGNHVFLTDNKK